MPSCFALTRKGEEEPTNLGKIDEELCAHLGIEVDSDRWCLNWYNTLGLLLAVGKTWDEIREIYKDEECYDRVKAVVDFLESNYNVEAWREYGRRNS